MPLVMCERGRALMLDWALGVAAVPNPQFEFRLFVNDYTPVVGSVLGDFTEATFPGYSRLSTIPGGWSSAVDAFPRDVSTYSPDLTWTVGATGQTVYGYYVLNYTDLTYLWAERFGTTRVLNPADKLVLTPKVSSRSEFE